MHEAKRICPAVIPVQARHRLWTDYHERMLAAVDTCVPVEKVCSIDEVAGRLMGDQRQVPVARALALKLKQALCEQIDECLTCSIGVAPNVFLGKVGSDLQKPGLVVITKENLPEILLRLAAEAARAALAAGREPTRTHQPERDRTQERDFAFEL